MKGLKIALLLLVLAFVLDVGRYLFFPRISGLRNSAPQESALMQMREKQWQKLGINKKPARIWVPYSGISPNLIRAVLISEDENFWKHDGFDLNAMQRAMERDIEAGRFKSGGSTITQQLAKNLFLSPSKSLFRKIKEAILTWRLENDLSKKRILELYLNYAEWGDGIFGAEAAARYYFAKPASGLSAIEAAKLAASLPNPERFNPNADNRIAERRSRAICRIMASRGSLNEGLEKIMAEIEKGDQPQEDQSAANQSVKMSPEKPEIVAGKIQSPGQNAARSSQSAYKKNPTGRPQTVSYNIKSPHIQKVRPATTRKTGKGRPAEHDPLQAINIPFASPENDQPAP